MFRKIATLAQAWSYMEHTRLKATDERLTTKDPLLFAAPLTAHEAGVLAAQMPSPSPANPRSFRPRLTLRPDTAVVFPGVPGGRTPVNTGCALDRSHCHHARGSDTNRQPRSRLVQQPNGTEWNVSSLPHPALLLPSQKKRPHGLPLRAVPFASNTGEVETGNTNASPSRGSSMTHARGSSAAH